MVSAEWYHQRKNSSLASILVDPLVDDELLSGKTCWAGSADLGAASQNRVIGAESGAIGCPIRLAVESSNWSAVLAESLVNLVTENGAIGRSAVSGASRLCSRVAELVGGGAGVSKVLRASNATFRYRMVLSADLRSIRDVRGSRGWTKLEDWWFPLIALRGKLFVLGGFGRDATW